MDESPIAEAGPDQTVCAGSEVHLDGSRSRDFDGVVDRFTWDFGDGTTGGGDRPVHVFDEPGDYRVTLTIEGDRAAQCDNTNSDEMRVRVVEAPIARIDAPDRVALGDAVVFDASGSSAASGRILAWRWDFGDGGTAEGAQAEHVFKTAGPHIVSLAIDTDAETSCSAVTGQRSILVNAAPLPDAGEDVVVGVDQEILFDASGSSDPDGAIVNYSWNFGDGTTGSGMYVRHRFRESGQYEVDLTVTDDSDVHNNTASDRRIVTVNHAPVPAIDAQASACAAEAVAFSGSRSSDPDGQIARFEWRFGNGTTVDDAEAQHVFPRPGTYDVDLVVDDGRGLNNSRAKATSALHVNRPPQPEAGPDRLVCPGDEVTFDGSTSIDWDGEISSYDWTFGDGATAKGVTVTHKFEKPGHYETRLAVTDDSGSACAVAYDVASTRVNAAPLAAAGADREGFAGGAHDQILFDASGSSDADGEILSYLWDFGEGITLSGEKVLHAFAAPGVYTVRLMASDGSGLPCGQAIDELTVTIRERDLKAATLAGSDE